jgi:hypothetical protein
MDRAFGRIVKNLENGQNFEAKTLKNIFEWIIS